MCLVLQGHDELHGLIPAPPTHSHWLVALPVTPLDARSFSWHDVGAKAWDADAGSFTVRIGRSSADPQLEGKVVVAYRIVLPVE